MEISRVSRALKLFRSLFKNGKYEELPLFDRKRKTKGRKCTEDRSTRNPLQILRCTRFHPKPMEKMNLALCQVNP